MKEPVKKARIDDKKYSAANLASSSDTETEDEEDGTKKSKSNSKRHSMKKELAQGGSTDEEIKVNLREKKN